MIRDIPPRYKHQDEGVAWLLEREERFALIGDEMRVGKTRQVIDAAQELYRRGEIERVIVIAPAEPRIEWASADPLFGQVAKFMCVPTTLTEYRSGGDRTWDWLPDDRAPLEWIVTNYEYMRRKPRLAPLLRATNNRTIVVEDESSVLNNFKSQTSKACQALRDRAGWVWQLNGTPAGDNPEAVFGQFYAMDWRIIGCRFVSEFRARYAVMNPFITREVKVKTPEGWRVKKVPVHVERWVNLDDLSKRTAPHILRRTCAEVFPDMPPQLPPSTIEVPLSAETWRLYKQMQRDSLAWLDENASASAAQAATRVIRLSQLTAGFVGGVECEKCVGLFAGEDCSLCGGLGTLDPRRVGTEKRDATVGWVKGLLAERPDAKVIVWGRFVPEVLDLRDALSEVIPTRLMMGVGKNLSRAEREETQRAIHPATAEPGALAVVGTGGTGAKGLNMAAASDMVFVSNPWSLLLRDQSMFRIVSPAQTRPQAYLDILATGPKGEPTVDHGVVKALREKRDVSKMTARDWASTLRP